VAYQHNTDASLRVNLIYCLDDSFPPAEVEVRSWFIQKQQLRFLRHCARDDCLPLFTPRDSAKRPVGKRRQPKSLNPSVNNLPVSARQSFEKANARRPPNGHDLPHRQWKLAPGGQQLRHIANPPAKHCQPRTSQVTDVLVQHDDLALRMPDKPKTNPQQRCLACTVRSHQRNNAALLDTQTVNVKQTTPVCMHRYGAQTNHIHRTHISQPGVARTKVA